MRQPEPFYRKQTASWYVRIGGKLQPLGGKDKPGRTPPDEVKEKYRAWRGNRQPIGSDALVAELFGKFLLEPSLA